MRHIYSIYIRSLQVCRVCLIAAIAAAHPHKMIAVAHIFHIYLTTAGVQGLIGCCHRCGASIPRYVVSRYCYYLWPFAPLSAIITPTICGRNMRISPRSVAAICGCHRYTGRFVLSRMMSWQIVSIQALLTNESTMGAGSA